MDKWSYVNNPFRCHDGRDSGRSSSTTVDRVREFMEEGSSLSIYPSQIVVSSGPCYRCKCSIGQRLKTVGQANCGNRHQTGDRRIATRFQLHHFNQRPAYHSHEEASVRLCSVDTCGHASRFKSFMYFRLRGTMPTFKTHCKSPNPWKCEKAHYGLVIQ